MTSRILPALLFAAALLLPHSANAQTVSEESAKQRVLHGLQLAAPVKTATVEYFVGHNEQFPTSLEQAGIKTEHTGDDVAQVSVASVSPEREVIITITYGTWAHPTNVLILRGIAMPGSGMPGDLKARGIMFRCSTEGSTINPAWLPESCKLL